MAAAGVDFNVELAAVGATYPDLRGLQLKEHQVTVIQHILGGRNCFVSLPTGYGKSLTYVLPSLILDERTGKKEHTSLIITPLLNLMKQQAAKLQKTGVAAVCISADITKADDNVLMGGKAQVIFSTPEAAAHPLFRKSLKELYKKRLALISVDESHCITTWGTETFRPSYRRIPELSTFFQVPFLFVTATATQKIKDDILQLFNMPNAELVIVLPNRPEIRLDVHRTPHNFKVLNWCIQRVRNLGVSAPKTVIFTLSIRESGDLYEYVMEVLGDAAFEDGIRRADKRFVEVYHSGVSEEREGYIMRSFPRPDTKIRLLASTIRLGMGVDIPDIHTVVLFGAPDSIVDMWQEVGRCSRAAGMTGLGVLYLTGKTINPKLKKGEWMRGLENPVGCHRQHIMEAFSTDGLDPANAFVPPTEVCESACVRRCQCEKCRCCDRCAGACPCSKRDIRPCCAEVEAVSDVEDDDEDDGDEEVQSD